MYLHISHDVLLSFLSHFFLSHTLSPTFSLSFISLSYLSLSLSLSLSHSFSLSLSLSYYIIFSVLNADYTVSSTTGASAESITSSVADYTTSGAFTATLATSFPNATVSTVGSPVGTYILALQLYGFVYQLSCCRQQIIY